ncbi:MAG: AmmeMemoRadiSam system protein B [Patescibacteria group bacterium]
MKKYFWLIAALAALSAIIVAGVLFFMLRSQTVASNNIQDSRPKTQDAIPLYDVRGTRYDPETMPASKLNLPLDADSPELLNLAFTAERDYIINPQSRIILIPHHLVAAREIANLLKASPKTQTIYFLMPDHFSQSKTCAAISDANWDAYAGRINTNPQIVANLTASSTLFSLDNSIFAREISFKALAPYLAKAYGEDVRIIPITVSANCSVADRQVIASLLYAELAKDPQSILISTVDFSHYQPAEVADFHDELAADVILGLADLEADKVELDSATALAITLKVARSLGLGDVVIHDHTNSLKLAKAIVSQDSTSHFFVSFSPGKIATQQKLTLMFFGDTMLDRTVATRSRSAGNLAYPFELIKGAEDRFMYGQDAIIANLEGSVTAVRRAPDKGDVDFAFDPKVAEMLKTAGITAVSQANNHTLDQGRAGAEESRKLLTEAGVITFGDQVKDDTASSLAVIESRGQKVALLGFNNTDNPLNKADAETAIKTAYEQARYVVVCMHWGNEYQSNPSMAQVELAHWFIDLGVDAVIGGHPHWMQSVEVYKDRPIIYSLGNFIFDQDWSRETNYGLVAGLVLGPENSDIYLFPIQINKSQPQILTGADRQTRLDRLANISNPALADQIKSGILKITP